MERWRRGGQHAYSAAPASDHRVADDRCEPVRPRSIIALDRFHGISLGRETAAPVTAVNTPLTCPILVARTHECATLHSLIAAARDGKGRGFLISGEAGIGKSRLVAEAQRIAVAQGFLPLQGDCFEADTGYPFAPLLDLLRDLFAGPTAAQLTPEREPLAGEIVRLLPDVAPLVPPIPAAPSPLAFDAEQGKRHLFAVLTQFFINLATRHPLLLVIEDLHWCDESSLELLHLIRRCASRPILFLCTYRDEGASPGLRHWLAQIDRERLAVDLVLGALSRPEVAVMLRAMLAAPDATHDDLAGLIFTLAEGNPFFVEEVLKSLIATGELRRVGGGWERRPDGDGPSIPRSVQDMLQQRAERLSAPAKRALTLAAVAGRRFDFALLQQALGCAEDQLLSSIKELIAAQLIVEESADRFAFRHALVQQAIDGGLLARERRSLHRVIVTALEAIHTSPAQREAYLVDLAHHSYAANAWQKALEYKQRAGEHALALHAPDVAITHLTHAVEAAHHLRIAPPAAMYRARGQAHAARGEFDRARADYERSLAAARATSDDAMLWQSMMALGFLWAGRDYRQAGAWFRDASDQASHLADPILRAHSLNRVGNWLSNTGRIEEGLQAHHEALAIFEEWDDAQGMAESFDLLGTTYGMRGDKISAVSYLGRAIPLFRTLGDAQSLSSSLAMHALQSLPWSSETTFSPLRPHDDAVQGAAEALQLARQIESPAAQAFAGNALSNAFLARGEFGPSIDHAREAHRIATEIGHRQWMVATTFVLSRTYFMLRAHAQAIPTSEAALSLARELGSMYWIATCAANLARAHMGRGDLPAAEAVLRAVIPRDQQARTMPERGLALAWGELALAQGEADVALQIAERLLNSAADSAPGQPAQPIPSLLKLQGEALLALSRLGEAAAALEGARRGAQERGSRPDLWAIHGSLGRAYRLLQRDDDDRREFAAARQLVEEMAATIEDEHLRDQFRSAALGSLPREKPLNRREAARRAFGGLTAREREVAALIVRGKTSREIADLLVVSERTAEVHVSNILGKLGFSSRAQIAAWAVEQGLGRVDID